MRDRWCGWWCAYCLIRRIRGGWRLCLLLGWLRRWQRVVLVVFAYRQYGGNVVCLFGYKSKRF